MLEGYRKWIVAIVTLIIEAFLVWKGMDTLTEVVVTNVVTVINAIFVILELFVIPVSAGIYMHYNVEAKKAKAITGKK